MNPLRTIDGEPAEVEQPTPRVSRPMSGPSYGPFDKARRSWQGKLLRAILADAISNNKALLPRLERGVYSPDKESMPYYKACLIELCKRTREQLAALEAFTAIDWSE
jgi:hypothetical protein